MNMTSFNKTAGLQKIPKKQTYLSDSSYWLSSSSEDQHPPYPHPLLGLVLLLANLSVSLWCDITTSKNAYALVMFDVMTIV